MICSSVSADLAADLGGLGDQLPGLAFQPGLVAFDLGQLGQRDQLLPPEIVDAFLLADDQLDLLFLGFALGLEAADFLAQLLDPLPELRLLTVARAAAQIEQLAFAIDKRRHFRIGFRAREEIVGEPDRVEAVALALQPCPARVKLVETLVDDRQVGAGDRVVETNDDVALLDAVAVAHAEFADDAAGRVLHLLDV